MPPPHLRSLPPGLADALSKKDRRALADHRTGQERRRRQRDAEGWANAGGPDALPPFLRAIEGEHPRTADLWLNTPPGSTLAEVHALGKRYGLSAADVDARLDALRRAELATLSAGTVTMESPGSVPF